MRKHNYLTLFLCFLLSLRVSFLGHATGLDISFSEEDNDSEDVIKDEASMYGDYYKTMKSEIAKIPDTDNLKAEKSLGIRASHLLKLNGIRKIPKSISKIKKEGRGLIYTIKSVMETALKDVGKTPEGVGLDDFIRREENRLIERDIAKIPDTDGLKAEKSLGIRAGYFLKSNGVKKLPDNISDLKNKGTGLIYTIKSAMVTALKDVNKTLEQVGLDRFIKREVNKLIERDIAKIPDNDPKKEKKSLGIRASYFLKLNGANESQAVAHFKRSGLGTTHELKNQIEKALEEAKKTPEGVGLDDFIRREVNRLIESEIAKIPDTDGVKAKKSLGIRAWHFLRLNEASIPQAVVDLKRKGRGTTLRLRNEMAGELEKAGKRPKDVDVGLDEFFEKKNPENAHSFPNAHIQDDENPLANIHHQNIETPDEMMSPKDQNDVGIEQLANIYVFIKKNPNPNDKEWFKENLVKHLLREEIIRDENVAQAYANTLYNDDGVHYYDESKIIPSIKSGASRLTFNDGGGHSFVHWADEKVDGYKVGLLSNLKNIGQFNNRETHQSDIAKDINLTDVYVRQHFEDHSKFRVAIPVSVNNNHWASLVIEKNDSEDPMYKLEYMDPMDNSPDIPKKIQTSLDEIKKNLKDEFGLEDASVSIKKVQLKAIQPGLSDCGAFLSVYQSKRLLGLSDQEIEKNIAVETFKRRIDDFNNSLVNDQPLKAFVDASKNIESHYEAFQEQQRTERLVNSLDQDNRMPQNASPPETSEPKNDFKKIFKIEKTKKQISNTNTQLLKKLQNTRITKGFKENFYSGLEIYNSVLSSFDKDQVTVDENENFQHDGDRVIFLIEDNNDNKFRGIFLNDELDNLSKELSDFFLTDRGKKDFRIFFPVALGKDHWGSMVIDKTGDDIHVIDINNKNHTQSLKSTQTDIEESIKSSFGTSVNVSFTSVAPQLQKDKFSCGPIASEFGANMMDDNFFNDIENLDEKNFYKGSIKRFTHDRGIDISDEEFDLTMNSFLHSNNNTQQKKGKKRQRKSNAQPKKIKRMRQDDHTRENTIAQDDDSKFSNTLDAVIDHRKHGTKKRNAKANEKEGGDSKIKTDLYSYISGRMTHSLSTSVISNVVNELVDDNKNNNRHSVEEDYYKDLKNKLAQIGAEKYSNENNDISLYKYKGRFHAVLNDGPSDAKTLEDLMEDRPDITTIHGYLNSSNSDDKIPFTIWRTANDASTIIVHASDHEETKSIFADIKKEMKGPLRDEIKHTVDIVYGGNQTCDKSCEYTATARILTDVIRNRPPTQQERESDLKELEKRGLALFVEDKISGLNRKKNTKTSPIIKSFQQTQQKEHTVELFDKIAAYQSATHAIAQDILTAVEDEDNDDLQSSIAELEEMQKKFSVETLEEELYKHVKSKLNARDLGSRYTKETLKQFVKDFISPDGFPVPPDVMINALRNNLGLEFLKNERELYSKIKKSDRNLLILNSVEYGDTKNNQNNMYQEGSFKNIQSIIDKEKGKDFELFAVIKESVRGGPHTYTVKIEKVNDIYTVYVFNEFNNKQGTLKLLKETIQEVTESELGDNVTIKPINQHITYDMNLAPCAALCAASGVNMIDAEDPINPKERIEGQGMRLILDTLLDSDKDTMDRELISSKRKLIDFVYEIRNILNKNSISEEALITYFENDDQSKTLDNVLKNKNIGPFFKAFLEDESLTEGDDQVSKNLAFAKQFLDKNTTIKPNRKFQKITVSNAVNGAYFGDLNNDNMNSDSNYSDDDSMNGDSDDAKRADHFSRITRNRSKAAQQEDFGTFRGPLLMINLEEESFQEDMQEELYYDLK